MSENTAAQSADPNNRRSVRSLLIKPREQLKYSFVFVGLGIIVLMVFVASVILFLSQTMMSLEAAYSLDPEVISAIRKSLVSALGLTLLLCVVLATFAIILGVQWTHKIYGPVVPMQRHIDALKEGDYSSRVNLRKGDELQELSDALNSLAESLEKKYGKKTV